MAKDVLKIRKGELVMLAPGPNPRTDGNIPCWRATNKQEDDAWEKFVQLSLLDDAGEPRVRSPHPYVTDYIPAGTPVIVVRSRCTADIGWYHYGKLVQVLIPSNGNTYFVLRSHVAKAEIGENPVR